MEKRQAMKKFLGLMISLSISPLLLYGMEEVSDYYSPDKGMRAKSTQEENHFSYGGGCPLVPEKLDTDFYKEAVETLPIMCVDTFLVDSDEKNYFLVYRKNRPAKGIFWVPGGRMIKGETFFQSAERKCKEEIGITIEAKKVLGTYNLMFSDSEWDTPTHTPVVAVLALYDLQKGPVSLNDLHADGKWVPLFEPNNIDYIEKMRKKVVKKILTLSKKKT